MSFENDVIATPEISSCFNKGLRAVRAAERVSFQCIDTTKIEGSVNIDGCLRPKYPNSNRWDYAIGYDEKCFFVEIHPASTSEVSAVIAKKNWLIEWLNSQNSPLLERRHSFHWIATGKVKIAKNSPQLRALNNSGIKGPKKPCMCQE